MRFIHTGDLHLGLRFTKVSFQKERAQERRRELWSTFERIVNHGKDQGFDLLLIAGDLFEDAYFTLGDITKVRDIFKSAENLNIVISAGNHDYKSKKSLYNKIEWTDNVTIFDGSGIEKKEFESLNTVIYGYSWDAVTIQEKDLFKGLKEEVDNSKNNILLLHGDVITDSEYLPLRTEELNSLGMDYIALGHIHKPQNINHRIAYCGCPEPLNFGETGERGIIEGSIIDKRLKFDFIPFSKRRFTIEEITINENMSYFDIVNLIKDLNNNYTKDDFFRIKLGGFLQSNISIKDLEQDLQDSFYYIEIEDNTTLDYDLDQLIEDNKDNIISKFITSMEEKGLDNPTVKNALYLGLEVLLKGRD